VGFIVETCMRQLETTVSYCASKDKENTIHTSAGEGLLCGQLIGFVDFALEFRRLPGCSTVSKLARRASNVSISWLIAAKKGSPGAIRPASKKRTQYLFECFRFCGFKKGFGVVAIGVALCLLRCFDLSASTRREERSHVCNCGLIELWRNA